MYTAEELRSVLRVRNGEFNSVSTLNFLKVEEDVKYKEVTYGSLTLSVPRDIRDNHHDVCLHMATVVYPSTDGFLDAGDVVYCHHFLTHKDNERLIFGDTVYSMRTDEIYLKIIDSEIHMLPDWILVEQAFDEIPQSASGLYLQSEPDEKTNMGYIRHVHPDKDIKPGSMVSFRKNSEYTLMVNDKLYYRMKYEDLESILT